ncbi:GntR family transcriptional regulator (plasmid) [Paracoccus sp. TD-10]|uniref:GntR family transcriptional regulator n=1 Tax=Paracoccus sp. TD-10 TaxID=3395918 RepID=UPI003AAFE402
MATTKSDFAYETIKSRILDGVLAPGVDVSEESLQRELALSRTPIREACQRLGKEGFIHIYPSKGMIVADITTDLIRDIYQMRLLNEPFIVVQACRLNKSRDWLEEIGEQLRNPPRGLSEAELRDWYIALDRRLHDGFLQNCRNRFLQSTMQTVLDHNHRIRMKVSRPYSNEDRSITEHLAIIDAFMARDETRLEQEAKAHIEASRAITFAYFM